MIIGGVHATFMPNEAAQYADVVLVGEGDSVIAEVVENDYKGIIQGKPCGNLDELPFPDLTLLKDVKLPLYYTPISTSRGCPFNCTFCSVTAMFGRQYRFRSPKSIVNELLENKHRRIFFYDDNFCALRTRTKEILKLMKEHKIAKPWMTQATINLADDEELLKLMADTNCEILCFGFESINPNTLKEYNKDHKAQELGNIKKSIKKIHDLGIKIRGMFVLGSDNDDKSTVKETVNFCKEYDVDYPQFSILTPLPGSNLFKNLSEQGRIFSRDWNLYDLNHVVYHPKNMSAYELQVKINEATKSLYWFTKRGFDFFFHNVFQGIEVLKKSFKWWKDHKGYLKFLEKVHTKKISPETNLSPQ